LTAGFVGRVVDERDRPLAGALVVAIGARPVRPQGDRAPRSFGPGFRAEEPEPPAELAIPGAAPALARTGADGCFSLPVLPPGRYILFAIDLGTQPATSEALVVEGGFLTVPLRLVISRGAQLL
jgi:hypothetical protein